MWVYPRTIPSGNLTILGRGGGAGAWNSTNGHQYLLFIYNNQFYFQRWTGSSLVSVNSSSGDTLTLNKWTHLAVSYDGTDLKVYRDGAQFLISTNATFGKPSSSNITRIGTPPASGGSYWDGFISNVRIVKGTALYTSNFSPTFTELTNLPNTKLLALQSSSSATAYAVSPGSLTAYGDAAASTTSPGLISPHSITGSVEFDGTGDYLTVADSSLNPGTGDFAVEAFIKFASNSGTRRAVVMDTGAYGSNSLSIQQYNNGFEFYCGGQNHYTSGFDMTIWHHALITRKSNTIRYIVDGKIIGTDTSSNNIYGQPTNTLTIGGYNSVSNSEYMGGYISNVRLVVGSVPSEYETTSTTVGTQIFTPTREELDNITDTKFLGLQSASSATAYAVSPASISVNGDASASSTSPGLVKAYTNAGGSTTTTTTTPGNLLVSGITTATNRIDIKSDDSTPGRIDFYCESSNAHYTQLRSAAHASYSGIATVTLPTSTGTLLLTDGSGASLTNLPAANLTGTLPAISGANLTNLDASDLASGTVPDARFPATLPAASGANLTNLPAANLTGTLPAISGANLTNLDASDLASGTVPDARFPATLPAASGANLTNLPAANITGTLPAISIGGDLSIVDKIVHTGNTNTSIGFPSNNKVQFATSGSPRMTLDSSGRVLIGTTGAPAGTDAQYSRLVIRGNTQSASSVAYLSLGNGNTTSDTGTNENLGILTFNDNDNDAGEYARIIGASDGANGTDDYPGKLIFSTTSDGGSAPTERMRITATGRMGLGTQNPTSVLDVSGTVTATTFSGSGASLTNLPAANLTGTLPAISGANLTNLDASDLASGTVPDARFPATLPAISGANLTNINATVAGISTTGTSTFNHVSVTGVATVSTAFYLPQYTTTARDAATFNEGAMIYNTTVKKMEFYDGTNWNTLPGVTLGLGMGVF